MNVDKLASGRKPYTSPNLVTYGTIADLTRGANLQVGDGFAGVDGNGSKLKGRD